MADGSVRKSVSCAAPWDAYRVDTSAQPTRRGGHGSTASSNEHEAVKSDDFHVSAMELPRGPDRCSLESWFELLRDLARGDLTCACFPVSVHLRTRATARRSP